VAHSGQAVNSYDVAVRTKAGKQCWLNVSILVSSANSKIPTPLVVHLFRDATRHKNREKFILQWLQEAERLQAATLPPLPPPPPSPRADDLTDREREVLALLAHGISTAKIARTLSISPATARNHIQNILNKLHVHSRLEAVAYAFEHGLVSRE
jgi:DNA-binding NarL/FixJ family response regulator